MPISTYAANKVLDHLLQVAAYAAPTVYLAASTTDPASVLTEPVGNNYSRVALSGKFSAASARSSSNTSLISFPQASGPWGTITHYALTDAPGTGAGNIIWSGALSVSKDVTANDTLSFAISNLTMSFT
jgi:hypothetical protein